MCLHTSITSLHARTWRETWREGGIWCDQEEHGYHQASHNDQKDISWVGWDQAPRYDTYVIWHWPAYHKTGPFSVKYWIPVVVQTNHVEAIKVNDSASWIHTQLYNLYLEEAVTLVGTDMTNATNKIKEEVRATNKYCASLFLRTSNNKRYHALKWDLVNKKILGDDDTMVHEGNIHLLAPRFRRGLFIRKTRLFYRKHTMFCGSMTRQTTRRVPPQPQFLSSTMMMYDTNVGCVAATFREGRDRPIGNS